jgi:pimeloyl-ACP methyl ester carboxylesterase
MSLMYRSWRKRLLFIAVLGVTFWLFASWLVADQMTRRAGPLRVEPLPAIAWGTIREVRLSTRDGQELGAWFIAGRGDEPTVLLLHGNSGTRADCLDQAEWLVAAGHPALLVTLRAHGDSSGDRNDFGYSARHDVIAAVVWLEQNCTRPPVIWGRSLGAAAGLFAAGELENRVGGYILECPYRDLRTAVRNRTRTHLDPPLDGIAYAGLSLTAPLVLDDVDRISPYDAAAGISRSVPVLILAGGNDSRATPAEAIAIGERIGARAEVIVFDGAEHLGLHRTDPERYRKVALRFLAACPSPGD